MHAIRSLLAIAPCFLFAGSSAAVAGEPPQTSIQVILDDSAALQESTDAEKFKKQLFHQLTLLRKKRATRDARIDVISVNNPRNRWTGTPTSLFRDGQPVLDLMGTVENGCSDYLGALDQARLNIEQSRAEVVRVYIFGSLIHTGNNCDGVKIELPQPAPNELNASFLSGEDTIVRVFWANHLQVRPWREAMVIAGLHDLVIFDLVSTQSELERGLGHD